MLERLAQLNRSAWFWIALIVLCIGMEIGALVYQYALYYDPCVLCVHIRAWILGILVAAIAGLFLRHQRLGLILSNLVVVLFSMGFVERAYKTLGTEMGFIDGACSMNPNFPSFLPLNDWLPTIFKPLTSCGYTPWVIPEVLSMAQALMTISVLLLTVMLVMLVLSLRQRSGSSSL